jgi:nitrogen fixation protein NifU and related proteins
MNSSDNAQKDQKNTIFQPDVESQKQMLSDCGYSERAIQYYIEKPYMGSLPDADQISDMVGTCGDTMRIFLKVDKNRIADVRYQVMGCAGAICAAMAVVDIVKGKDIEQARDLNDGDVFRVLVDIPAKKHHCIQLAVKTLHKAIDEYKTGHSDLVMDVECQSVCDAPKDCCKKADVLPVEK